MGHIIARLKARGWWKHFRDTSVVISTAIRTDNSHECMCEAAIVYDARPECFRVYTWLFSKSWPENFLKIVLTLSLLCRVKLRRAHAPRRHRNETTWQYFSSSSARLGPLLHTLCPLLSISLKFRLHDSVQLNVRICHNHITSRTRPSRCGHDQFLFCYSAIPLFRYFIIPRFTASPPVCCLATYFHV